MHQIKRLTDLLTYQQLIYLCTVLLTDLLAEIANYAKLKWFNLAYKSIEYDFQINWVTHVLMDWLIVSSTNYRYINSPGGSVTAGLAIYDTMQYVLPPISTWCVGQACSMGSLLLAAGTHVSMFYLLYLPGQACSMGSLLLAAGTHVSLFYLLFLPGV